MDVREAIDGRRAVREFTTEIVDGATLRQLVDAGKLPDTDIPVAHSKSIAPTKEATNSRRQGRRKAATVSWYGMLLIVGALLAGAGWEIFRWILAIITLD